MVCCLCCICKDDKCRQLISDMGRRNIAYLLREREYRRKPNIRLNLRVMREIVCEVSVIQLQCRITLNQVQGCASCRRCCPGILQHCMFKNAPIVLLVIWTLEFMSFFVSVTRHKSIPPPCPCSIFSMINCKF